MSFSDDRGVIGTTGGFLRDITLSNGTLTAVSIIIIAVFSVLLMFSFDPVESRVFVTLFGVALVVLSYFASLGFAIMIGIKLNVRYVNSALLFGWTDAIRRRKTNPKSSLSFCPQKHRVYIAFHFDWFGSGRYVHCAHGIEAAKGILRAQLSQRDDRCGYSRYHD